jgi:hypothetical protein
MSLNSLQHWEIKAASDIQPADFLQWQQLVDQYHSGNLMLSSPFVSQLLATFSTQHYLASCTLNSQVKLMLVVQKRRPGIWELAQLSQAQSALVVGAQSFKPDLAALLSTLPGLVLRLDFFCLDPLDHEALIDSLRSHALDESMKNIRVDCQSNFTQYWQARSKNLRKNINRYENRLVSEGKQTKFLFHTESTAVFSAVDRYGMLESRGWKGKNGTSLHPCNKQGVFYQKNLTNQADIHQAMVIEFYIDDQLAASRLCCFNSEIFIILKTTYDEDLKAYAPGRLLLAEVIKYVMEHKTASVIDFYTHATEEQIDWATDVRPMYKGSFYRPPLLKTLDMLLTRLKRSLK